MSAQSGLNTIAPEHEQPDGIYWQDDIYLVPTSEIDGRRRWQTIILLLAQKIEEAEFQQPALASLFKPKREMKGG